jgi:serine/threonine protein phosphatase PrpC
MQIIALRKLSVDTTLCSLCSAFIGSYYTKACCVTVCSTVESTLCCTAIARCLKLCTLLLCVLRDVCCAQGDLLFVNNVGDSRAILCSEEAGALTVKALSLDQTPFRRDERERVKAAGGKVSISIVIALLRYRITALSNYKRLLTSDQQFQRLDCR